MADATTGSAPTDEALAPGDEAKAPGRAKAPGGAPKAAAKAQGAKRSWRPLLRALHRDAGYLAVGLTLIYAVSGLAVNHISDWDPNFQNYERTVGVGRLTGDDNAMASQALGRLGVHGTPQEVYRASPTQLEIVLENRSIHLNTATGIAVDEGQKPRFFLRAANWLHLNRGKRAWRYIADAYAAGLLLLAVSGIFMIPGKKGLRGRGGLLVALGAAVPIAYVALSGGPGAASGKGPAAPKEAPGPQPAELRRPS
jgi:uncharacterized protein